MPDNTAGDGLAVRRWPSSSIGGGSLDCSRFSPPQPSVGQNTSIDGHAGSGLSTQTATSVTVGLAPKVNAIVNVTQDQTCDLQVNRILVVAGSLGVFGPVMAQTVSGTVVAEDTGAPIGGATVLAIRRTASRAEPPVMYKAVADAAGRYAMTVTAGEYRICVHDVGLHLNPCRWEPASPAVTVATGTVANLRLQKGAWLIVRIHDTPRVLSQVETARGSGVGVQLSAASLREFPLPLIYEDDRIRDYGLVVPMNFPLRARIASARVALADREGRPLSTERIPLQVTPADFPARSTSPSQLTWMSSRPSAKFLHVNTVGRK